MENLDRWAPAISPKRRIPQAVDNFAITTDNPYILFVSRGRGRGHATQDLDIASHLRTILPRASITLASYGTGANVIYEAGEKFIDLGCRDNVTYPDIISILHSIVAKDQPEIVISHEELGALTVARLFGIPSALITHWFFPRRHPLYSAQRHANQIIFTESDAAFKTPTELLHKTSLVGPLVRELKLTLDNKEKLLRAFRIEPSSFLVLVAPGSPSDARVPIFDLVSNSFADVPFKRKHLVWIAGDDFDSISMKTESRFELTVLRTTGLLDQLMLASDLVITKGTYNILCELTILRKPSISLSSGLNSVDDKYARLRPFNTHLDLLSLDRDGLTKAILDASADPCDKISSEMMSVNAASVAVRIVKSFYR